MDRHAWNDRYAAAGLVWTAEPNRTFAAEVAALPPGSALDLGAGEGRNATWLARQGWTATAFDLVAVIYLHLPDDERREVHRRATTALAPGGTLIVLGHDTTNLADGHGGPQDADVLFTPDDVVSDLEPTGLTIIKSGRVRRKVTTADGDRIAIDALVTARR